VVAVLLGTLYPLIADVLKLGKLSVGPPYFNFLFVPLTLILMLTLGIGVVMNWKKHRWETLFKPLSLLALMALLLGFLTPLWMDDTYHLRVALAMSLVFWVVAVNGWDLYRKVSTAKQGYLYGLKRLSRSYKGMLFAHIGLGVMVVGIAMTSFYSIERDVRLEPGQSVVLDHYEFYFDKVEAVQGDNYDADRGRVVVKRQGQQVALLHPEKRTYWANQNKMTEAAIDPGLFRDLYVALGEPLDDDKHAWAVRVYVKPFVRWIWGGALLMAIGGLLAISDRRYRLVEKRVA